MGVLYHSITLLYLIHRGGDIMFIKSFFSLDGEEFLIVEFGYKKIVVKHFGLGGKWCQTHREREFETIKMFRTHLLYQAGHVWQGLSEPLNAAQEYFFPDDSK